MFSVSIICHSKIKELSDGKTKTENTSKQIAQLWDPLVLSYGWWKQSYE